MNIFLALRSYAPKAGGANHNIIGTVSPTLVDKALREIETPDTWPSMKRDRHHILRQGRSLILRDEWHRDTLLRSRYPAINALVELVASLNYGTVPGKITVAYLPPGSSIKPHHDSGEYYKYHNRIHVPLITHPLVLMTSDAEQFHMSVGNIYLFQNLKRHAAANGSDQGRLHLIIDMLDPRYNATLFRKLRLVLATNFLWFGSIYRSLRYLWTTSRAYRHSQ